MWVKTVTGHPGINGKLDLGEMSCEGVKCIKLLQDRFILRDSVGS
jgi:hypothetical protein